MKKPIFQLLSTAVVIAIGVAALQFYASHIATIIVAILFGAFAKFSDNRKFSIYALGILIGSCIAETGTWIVKAKTFDLQHATNSPGWLLVALPIAILVSFAFGYYGRKAF